MRRSYWLLIPALLALPGSAALVSRPTGSVAPAPEAVAPSAARLPTAAEFECLARADVLAFLRASVHRYQREIHGFTALLEKQEYLNGKLGLVELVEVAFRDDPHSVFMKWRNEPAGRADRALYVAGANDDKSLARPHNRAARFLVGIVARDPDGPDARAAGRYTLPEFGLRKGTERTLAAWSAAERKGILYVEYLGIQSVPEAGGHDCYVLRRTCDPPEEDGIVTVEVAFDTVHWLQVGNVLTAATGRRIGAYYFRDIVLNPELAPESFERASLLKD